MVARHIKIDSEKVKDLKELSLHFEEFVDKLEDDELDAVENELQEKIRAILQSTPAVAIAPAIPSIKTPPIHHSIRKTQSSWKAGAGALLMAAAVLLVVRLNRPDSADSTLTWQTKGEGVGLGRPCKSRMIQSNLNDPKADQMAIYSINPDFPTFLNVDCPKGAFVHVAQRQANSWTWLTRNQRLENGFVLDANGDALNLTDFLGQELRVLATQDELPQGASDPDALAMNAWSEELNLRLDDHRAN